MKSEWRKMKFSDIVEFNPKENLPKGTVSKKIGMDKLQPFCRDVTEYETTEYTGGSKFRNGDTIMARITPCLENGKTSKVNILKDDEIGFGSTEYIVFRAKGGISDPDYIYYLVCSPSVREPAIKSMVGSSGRQRVQTDVIQSLELAVPPLEEQVKIGSVLKALDDKIAVNVAINDNLEQQLQAVFLEMFGFFLEALPENKCQPLGNLVDSIDNRGKTPHLAENETEYPIIDVKALSGMSRIVDYNNCTKYVEVDTYNNWFRSGHPKPMDILISTVGSLAEMKIFLGSKGCVAQNVVAFRSKGISPLYLYQYLTTIKNDLVAYNIGSVQPSIKVSHIIKHLIYVPTDAELEKYNNIANAMTKQIYKNCLEIERLVQLRDALLPKLMFGDLDVSNIDI